MPICLLRSSRIEDDELVKFKFIGSDQRPTNGDLFLSTSVMATSPYRIAIRAKPHLDRCVEMAPGPMKDCVDALISQALNAVCTEPALAALFLQAKRWAQVHARGTRMATLEKLAHNFQYSIQPNPFLDNATRGPMILVDMSMEDTVLGESYSPQNFSEFSLSQARIALNGKVEKI